jgi:hypothetical protein
MHQITAFGHERMPYFVVFSGILGYNICWIFMRKNQYTEWRK